MRGISIQICRDQILIIDNLTFYFISASLYIIAIYLNLLSIYMHVKPRFSYAARRTHHVDFFSTPYTANIYIYSEDLRKHIYIQHLYSRINKLVTHI